MFIIKTYTIDEVKAKYLPRCKFGITTLKYILCYIHDQRVCNFNKIKFITENKLKELDACFDAFEKAGLTATIFGFQEFCGDIYHYSPKVFIPKLTTQTLVKQVVKKSNINQDSDILDLCTGSGCVSISITKEIGCNADACDLHEDVISIAKSNNDRLGGNVNFFTMNVLGDWSKQINKKYDVIVSNPPYWSKKIANENKNIVDSSSTDGFLGGEDGLLFIKKIIDTAVHYLKPNGMLFLEFADDQKEQVVSLLKENYKDIRVYKDWHHNPKVVAAKIK